MSTINDINFLKFILPSHYRVMETVVEKGNIRCKSSIGIEEEEWESIKNKIKSYFGKRLAEIYHNTCTLHLDFIVYLNFGKKIEHKEDSGVSTIHTPKYIGDIAITPNWHINQTQKPKFIHRWFMRILLGWKWVDTRKDSEFEEGIIGTTRYRFKK